ncbi:MAG: DUF1080 domain-containing protein [Planctomycetota bacterium]|mgnify:FL=1|nr:DUF1080 domain-containing protein [Planctomycetota bacterium]
MTLRRLVVTGSLAAVVLGALCIRNVAWNIEAVKAPRVIDPGSSTKAPSDAIVLFDGKNLDEWVEKKGGGAWKVEDGIMTIAPGTGDMYTKRKFGDIQLHMEWRIPADSKRKGESKGNSGIKFHSAYEIQVLDNFKNQSNPKGQAGSVYKQHVPLVNACRPPGQWQTYDIVFRAPYFDKAGKRVKMGTFTVFHNGILVQDKVNIFGRTNSNRPVSPDYKQAFFLQDHGSLVSYRNIWVRELERLPLD